MKSVTIQAKQKFWLAMSCLLGIFLLRHELNELDGSEFIGGRITGPLFTLAESGALFLTLGLVLIFFRRRLASGVIGLASLLCWPLYAYLTFPGIYRHVFKGEYSVPLQSNANWDWWSITEMLALLLQAYFCLNVFLKSRRQETA